MKYVKIALALASVTLLMVPGMATAAQKHHSKKCPSGKHRSGNKCVKNPTAGARSPGTQGPTGPAGPTGPSGPAGSTGPEGDAAPVSPFVYDNITPESRIDNPVSLGYAATGTTEFGSQIALGREGGITNPDAEVLMSVWTCETGEWNLGCVTANPAATFPAQLTLNIYAVTYENEVGALIATKTQTFNLHYRPSSDATCPLEGGVPTRFKASDGNCQHGSPQSVLFDGIIGALPHKVIVAVKFTPSGPTNALNVGVEGPASVGSNPVEAREGIYWDSQWNGTPGPFSLEEESGEWQIGESQIAARIIG